MGQLHAATHVVPAGGRSFYSSHKDPAHNRYCTLGQRLSLRTLGQRRFFFAGAEITRTAKTAVVAAGPMVSCEEQKLEWWNSIKIGLSVNVVLR